MTAYVSTRDGGKSSEEGLMKPWLRLFSSGVPISNNVNSLKATQRGAGANMSVDLAIGDAGLALANYMYWGWTDAVTNVIIAGSDPTNPRIDIVVGYVDLSVVSSAANNNPGALKFVSVTGTAAATPAVASDATIQATIGAGNPFVKINTVAVAALASNIVNANIADIRSDIAYKGQLSTGNGWNNFNVTPTTITANGNRSYTVVTNGTDLTLTASEGMRVRMTPSVAAPTQCTSLNGTTQYYSRASAAPINGMTFTNNFVVSAWVKLSSYGISVIASRYSSGSASGWQLQINSAGQPYLAGYNAGASNINIVQAYQSIPLNKWVHVAAQLDMSSATLSPTVNYIMLDGIDVPCYKVTGGTNPTTLVQAGNLEIGSAAAGAFFPGKIAQVAIYSAKVTQATILASMHQTLVGTETNLVSAYSFNNSIVDLNANANNLTANGSAVATNTDTPFQGGTYTYGIIMAKAFSTNTTYTISVPEGYTLPTTGGISAFHWSNAGVPYGFPKQRGKWVINYINKNDVSQATPTQNVWYNIVSTQLNIPIGSWIPGYEVSIYGTPTSGANSQFVSLSIANNSESDTELTTRLYGSASASGVATETRTKREGIDLSIATTYYLNSKTDSTTMNSIAYKGSDSGATIIYAENAYL